MKSVLAAVAFMFALGGCSDDTEGGSETYTPSYVSELQEATEQVRLLVDAAKPGTPVADADNALIEKHRKHFCVLNGEWETKQILTDRRKMCAMIGKWDWFQEDL